LPPLLSGDFEDCTSGLQARKKEGAPNLRVKDLRSYFASKLAECGAQMHDIQQLLGYASVAAKEKHYAQFSREHSSKKVLRVLGGGKRNGNKTETVSEVA
jgi:integrase